MPTRYDPDKDLDDSPNAADREISLGTGTVLAIFLALALVCSLFFGLGYSMGRKSASAVSTTVAAAASSSAGETGAGRASPDSVTATRVPSSSTAVPTGTQVVQPMEGAGVDSDPGLPGLTTANQAASARALAHLRPSPSTPLGPVPDTAPAATIAPALASTGPQSFVQIAAVSRKEDADLLLAALKRRGYTGIVRPQSQDKLLHVQVGPFATKKDAEAMRQHLIADGYNPILK